MFKYKPGYFHLYKNHKGHYSRQLTGNINNRMNKNWLYDSKPPEDNEENWYMWHKYHCVKLECELHFCKHCERTLNPSIDMMGRFGGKLESYRVCQKCEHIEDQLHIKFLEIKHLTKRMRDVVKRKGTKHVKKRQNE